VRQFVCKRVIQLRHLNDNGNGDEHMTKRKREPVRASAQTNSNEMLSLWVEATEKIVSFHEVDGWRKMEFQNREYRQRYVDSLVSSHYRFQ
jgi:hypothetical protein